MARILLAEDDEIMRITLTDRFIKAGWEVKAAADGSAALEELRKTAFHIVISDIRMPGLDGIALMIKVKQLAPATEVILMTAFGSVDDAVNCLKNGASDYILKPFDMDDLVIRVTRLLKMQTIRTKCAILEEQSSRSRLIGNSPPMRHINELIEQVAQSDATILITGESGTGKEIIAAKIHQNSARAGGAYIKINCAAMPENLIESELFGHEKGAFTGADKRKAGKFELADHGTILLDEIGDMPLQLQVKLLRVLEEREVEPVGGHNSVRVDIRVIGATAKNLEEEADQGRFRKDLLYRLKVIPIDIPPLRYRKEDIPLLGDYFLSEFNRDRKMNRRLSPDAMAVLSTYDFPGNVRELRNIIERISVLTRHEIITADDLPYDIRHSQPLPQTGRQSLNLALAVARVEKEYIRLALEKSRGNKTEAASLLGISRKNLWEKMKNNC